MRLRYKAAVLLYHLMKPMFKLSALHNGSSFPGMVARKLCNGIIKQSSCNVNTVLVAGTNGKTTTVRMICEMISASGRTVSANREGSNLTNGIVSAFLDNTTVSGKPINEYVVIECDEKCFADTVSQTVPHVIVITNVFSDQVYRLGEKKNVVSMFRDSIKSVPDTAICINRDNADSMKIVEDAVNNIIYFGVSDDSVHVNDRVFKPKLSLKGRFNLMNAAASCASCEALGLLTNETAESLTAVTPAFGRMETLSYNGKTVSFHLVKNTVSLNETIHFLKEERQEGRCILGINDNYCDDKNIEWFFNSDVAELSAVFPEIIPTGACKNEINAFFGGKYNTVSEKEIASIISDGEKDTVLILNYSLMMYVRKILYKNGILKEFWK